jgi:hypothetical protein
MTTKLTLSVDDAVVERAKAYAKQSGRSLSQLIEHYLVALTENEADNQTVSPGLQRIVGAITLPQEFDEEAERRAYLSKKHK